MAKGFMIIDGQRVAFDGEKNVLSVVRKAGIEMPTFCYHSDLSTYGACRMCIVEDERGKIDAACSMEPRDGMNIKTTSLPLLKHRRTILELLLASHDCNCTTCEKSGSSRIVRRCLRSRMLLVLMFMPSRGSMEQAASIFPRSSSTMHMRHAP